ncbi:antirepressor [Gordonia phage Zirinka]|uniref:Antirepressor n=9 Tax=Caudoviricetes TaxID=2731619 RepID=A0A142K8T5_9CAUD|nr:antirepressor [Gordonia phage Zirinka]YP_009301410.1 antirepressor protein [Gordonia phage Kita]YP_009303038.1 antirepressor [Gordonia phage SoilAssassin]YP_009595801.1 antirepressor [Gordonia phage Attis]YP_010653540.1 anti-repressor Ant [Gordonia phage Pickett]YP_010653616.1 anti-repressor Ant [Gordonia phage Yeet412]AYQ99188.1 antirepressor [Gordonia phage Bialota]QCG77467.1 antirepressor [Gordonia phage Antonio]QDF18365.1 antirepressor [Gordonia phage LordFarquaad]UYL86421.1 antirep
MEKFVTNDITPHNGASSPFDSIRRVTSEGREFWSARDLMPLLGYDEWRKFDGAIDRARISASNAGYTVTDHFVGAAKVAASGPAAKDHHLSRYACYLIALNGDPRKPEIAAAQTYFVIRTREAEVSAPALTGPELLAAAVLESQRVIEQREARIHQLERVVTDQAPKVTYVDTYVTDADLLSFSTVASSNGVKESWLRDLLIERDWIYAQQDSRWSEQKQKKVTRNRYSEKAAFKRYFRRIEVHEAPRFRGSEVMHTLKITPQGAEAIARLVTKVKAA